MYQPFSLLVLPSISGDVATTMGRQFKMYVKRPALSILSHGTPWFQAMRPHLGLSGVTAIRTKLAPTHAGVCHRHILDLEAKEFHRLERVVTSFFSYSRHHDSMSYCGLV